MCEETKCINCLTIMELNLEGVTPANTFYVCPKCGWYTTNGIWWDDNGNELNIKDKISDEFAKKNELTIRSNIGNEENRKEFTNCLVCESELRNGYMILTVENDGIKKGELCSEDCYHKYREQEK